MQVRTGLSQDWVGCARLRLQQSHQVTAAEQFIPLGRNASARGKKYCILSLEEHFRQHALAIDVQPRVRVAEMFNHLYCCTL